MFCYTTFILPVSSRHENNTVSSTALNTINGGSPVLMIQSEKKFLSVQFLLSPSENIYGMHIEKNLYDSCWACNDVCGRNKDTTKNNRNDEQDGNFITK